MITPLYVDLDGTLLRGDSLHESLLRILVKPSSWFGVFSSLLKGKAAFKKVVSGYADTPAEFLPYRQDFLEWLKNQKNSGRRLILTTGADSKLATAVANHLSIFNEVLASDGHINLTGKNKLNAIKTHAKGSPFAYAGNGEIDLKIWAEAASIILVGEGVYYEEKVDSKKIEARFPNTHNSLRAFIRLLRPHQWAKNILVFLPAAAAHSLNDVNILRSDIILFGAFSLCASGVYAMNDLLDLESDRKHTEKCYRPLAVGSVGIPVGIVVSLIFPLLAQVLAFIGAGWPGFLMILGYWLVTTYYSLHGKRIPLVDVFLLAGLYTFRAFGGALIIPTGLSPWMVAFLLFLFLGLACLKRFSELIALPDVHDGTVSGRGYIRSDYSLVAIMGVGAAFIASLIVCLYATSTASLLLYAHPIALMGIAPIVLFGLLRLWLQSWRRMMHSDPVLHALKDKISYLLIVLCAGCILWATKL